MSKLVYVDFERCGNCRGCEVACRREHASAPLISIVLVGNRFAVPLTCRHCDPAPCVDACPADALAVTESGVMLDADKCTGCTLCVFACPFGVMTFDEADKKAAHCDLCADRLARGSAPACVLTCPSGALAFDDYDRATSGTRRRASSIIVRSQPAAGGAL